MPPPYTLSGTPSQPRARRVPENVLTIAGHDPSSGAGITADLQTFAAHGLFGTSAITALTVQSTLGVAALHPVDPDVLRDVLAHLAADLPPAGIKIGMLATCEIVATVATFLRQGTHLGPTNPSANEKHRGTSSQIPIVLDPVLRSSSGADLLTPDALATLHARLIPHITWITPNWSELATLTTLPVTKLAEAATAAHALGVRHPHLYIVATAGDHTHPDDLLRLPTGETQTFPGKHIATTSTHGTGCAFSSALLACLVLGDSPTAAVQSAKHYVTEALRRAPPIGHGRGPLNLLWPLTQP